MEDKDQNRLCKTKIKTNIAIRCKTKITDARSRPDGLAYADDVTLFKMEM